MARVLCPIHWPAASLRQPPLSFRLNLSDEALRRRETAVVWRTHGPVVGVLLQTASPLTLDELEAACHEHARCHPDFTLSRHNMLFLVQLVLRPELRHTCLPRTMPVWLDTASATPEALHVD
ncbi:MAG: hypothetical protein H6659_11675 [Ardenticatenaceae bacterium]|nr:hypothetical protein [Ardenticatenaceae bacterium]